MLKCEFYLHLCSSFSLFLSLTVGTAHKSLALGDPFPLYILWYLMYHILLLLSLLLHSHGNEV